MYVLTLGLGCRELVLSFEVVGISLIRSSRTHFYFRLGQVRTGVLMCSAFIHFSFIQLIINIIIQYPTEKSRRKKILSNLTKATIEYNIIIILINNMHFAFAWKIGKSDILSETHKKDFFGVEKEPDGILIVDLLLLKYFLELNT